MGSLMTNGSRTKARAAVAKRLVSTAEQWASLSDGENMTRLHRYDERETPLLFASLGG